MSTRGNMLIRPLEALAAGAAVWAMASEINTIVPSNKRPRRHQGRNGRGANIVCGGAGSFVRLHSPRGQSTYFTCGWLVKAREMVASCSRLVALTETVRP